MIYTFEDFSLDTDRQELFVPMGEETGTSRDKAGQKPLAAPPLAPAAAETLPGLIDKSELTFGEPKRLRDKAQVCGQPAVSGLRAPAM